MPILRAPQQERFIILPWRARFASRCDILVVGAGPAGIGASVAASRLGCHVILAERYGFLGGNATTALVMPFMSFSVEKKDRKDTKEPLIRGVLQEFLQKLIADKGAIAPSRQTGYTVPFDPEKFKTTAQDFVDEAGVKILFHSFAIGVIPDNSQATVIFATKSGLIGIQASVVIDATGDGDIAAQAGEDFTFGRPQDGLTQPMTLMFRMGEFQPSLFQAYVRKHTDQWKDGIYGLWDLIKQAEKDKRLKLKRENILFFRTPHKKEVSVNSTRIGVLKGNNVWDLSEAEYQGKKQMRQIAAFLHDDVPGFQNSYVMQSGTQVCVRETRHIRGLYTLTEKDVLSGRSFPDAIARSSYPVDIHNPKGKGTLVRHLPPGVSYTIPLRCLIPQKNPWLLLSGRCISGTHTAHASYRIMAVCMATGQAAGVCAGLAIRGHVFPKEVPAARVRRELFRQGADPGPEQTKGVS